MSEQTPDATDRDPQQDAAAAGSTDEPAGNLTVEDDPQGTTDPADLAGTGGPEDVNRRPTGSQAWRPMAPRRPAKTVQDSGWQRP
jgi:hypothetical protein